MIGKIKKLARLKKFWLAVAIALLVIFFIGKKNGNGFEKTEVKRGTIREELILSGEIDANQFTSLTFQSSGELASVNVTEGQLVAKGDVLAKLDSTVVYQSYLQAEADLRNYQAALDKVLDEVKGHDKDETFTQRTTRTSAEVARDKAYRAYVAAQKSLSNTTLRAPFDGIVTNITHPYTGINTSLTESQITIINPESIYLTASADQSEVTKLSLGQKVAITLDAFDSKEYSGEVSYLGLTPKVGEIGAVYEVKVKFTSENTDVNSLRVGMTGDAKFITAEKVNVLYIPTGFISSDSEGEYLKLGKPDNKTYIQTGLAGEDNVEVITDKVSEGDTVLD